MKFSEIKPNTVYLATPGISNTAKASLQSNGIYLRTHPADVEYVIRDGKKWIKFYPVEMKLPEDVNLAWLSLRTTQEIGLRTPAHLHMEVCAYPDFQAHIDKLIAPHVEHDREQQRKEAERQALYVEVSGVAQWLTACGVEAKPAAFGAGIVISMDEAKKLIERLSQ